MRITPSVWLLRSVGSLLLLAIISGTAHALGWSVPALLDSLLIAASLCLLLFAIIDAWRVQQQPSPQLQREVASGVSLQHSYNVTLRFSHTGSSAMTLQYFDHIPDSFACTSLPYSVRLKANCVSQTDYTIKPLRRGAFQIPGCSIRLPSPMRLWSAQRF